LVKSRIKVWFF